MTVSIVFLAALLVAVGLEALAVAALARHKRRGATRRAASPDPPMVSIVKPLCGMDDSLDENLESFFRLDYPAFEVVFSFASADDPALPVARRVADRHIGVPSVFVIDPREPGLNAKVNRLAFGLARARGQAFLLADGDVRVEPGFLKDAVAILRDPSVGLVSHLFRAVEGATLSSRLEALYLDGILRPGTAAVAVVLRQPCVVGKALLLSRGALQAIGGISVLRNHLAEDYLLGRLVTQAGFRVVLSPYEVETRLGSRSPSSVWQRHRRWAILRQRLGGASYASEAFSSPVPFVAGAVLGSRGASPVVAAALLLWLARIAIEARALRRDGRGPRIEEILAIPLRDVAAAALFWAGLFGRRTSWRGRVLTVGPKTLLEPRSPGTLSAAPGPALPAAAERG